MRCSPCAIPPQLPDKQGLHQAVSPKPLYPTPLGHLLAVPPPSLIFVLVPAQGQEIFQFAVSGMLLPSPPPITLSSLQGDTEWMLLGDTGDFSSL